MLETPELKESEFNKFRKLIYESCGINLNDNKVHLVKARLGKRIRKLQFDSFSEYYKYVLKPENSDEFVQVLDAISTNTTFFFREGHHFDFLNRTSLPELIQKKKKDKSKKIRVWSAGCSTGEEPYSLALTLLEMLGNEQGWDVKVLATDISTKVLKLAHNGVYDKNKLQGIPNHLLPKYFNGFEEDGTKKYQVKDNIHRLITFRRLNLMNDSFPFKGQFDFIFCRNVMIYFDKPTRERLINRIYNYLETGGYFFIGSSESFSGLNHKYTYVKPSIFRK
jgi:chemotaxis protein methyltransferase CheR